MKTILRATNLLLAIANFTLAAAIREKQKQEERNRRKTEKEYQRRNEEEIEREMEDQLNLYSELIKQIKIEELEKSVFGKFMDPGFNEKISR